MWAYDAAPNRDTRDTRLFPTGATRDAERDKLDYEGFLSPLVLRRFAEYMHAHRMQSDGQTRDSDNWQRGMPRSVYMKSMFRHFMDIWLIHRSGFRSASLQDALCAVMFNAMGYLYELLSEREGRDEGACYVQGQQYAQAQEAGQAQARSRLGD